MKCMMIVEGVHDGLFMVKIRKYENIKLKESIVPFTMALISIQEKSYITFY